jgi:hypothetical protein
MLTYGSRYIQSTLVLVTTPDGVTVYPTVLDRPHYDVNDLTHGWSYRAVDKGRVAGSIDFDLLAFEITGREGMWFLLADVNDIEDPFDDIGDNQSLIVPTQQSFRNVIAQLDNRAR